MEEQFEEISIKNWESWKKQNRSHILVDVREEDEFLDFNIGGLNVPAHQISDNISQLSKFKKIVLVCSNGLRSSIMARVIKKKIPHASVFHLTEGILNE